MDLAASLCSEGGAFPSQMTHLMVRGSQLPRFFTYEVKK